MTGTGLILFLNLLVEDAVSREFEFACSRCCTSGSELVQMIWQSAFVASKLGSFQCWLSGFSQIEIKYMNHCIYVLVCRGCSTFCTSENWPEYMPLVQDIIDVWCWCLIVLIRQQMIRDTWYFGEDLWVMLTDQFSGEPWERQVYCVVVEECHWENRWSYY